MMLIVKYETEEEAQQIIAEKESARYTLVEVSNVKEGNFLGFQEPGWTPPVPPEVREALEVQVAELQQADIENKQAIADLTMTMAAMMG